MWKEKPLKGTTWKAAGCAAWKALVVHFTMGGYNFPGLTAVTGGAVEREDPACPRLFLN